MGDSIEEFSAGDLVLLGPHLPHFWLNEGHNGNAHSIVVQFREELLGADFVNKPELAAVRNMLRRSSRGLVFSAKLALALSSDLRELSQERGLKALILLLKILDRLTQARARFLTSAAYEPSANPRAQARMTQVCTYMVERFRDPITLAQIAQKGGMSPAAFSRYFKRASGRNVSAFLTELRIGHAARLLQETPAGIAEIAYASGYETLSNFNRRFREQLKCSPREYRQAFMKNQ